MRSPGIAIVGATGLVGERLLQLFDERSTDIHELRLIARRADGRIVKFRGQSLAVEALDDVDFSEIDIVFLSAGSDFSAAHARRIAACGPVVIDNSNAHRMAVDVPLIVPQINADQLRNLGRGVLIANPNCSTIPIARTLHALRKLVPQSMVVSTYQAVSGAGHRGLSTLLPQSAADTRLLSDQVFGDTILGNLLPSIDRLLESGETVEERKMRQENRKILGRFDLEVSTTCVRVPVLNCHAASVCVDFKRRVDMDVVMEELLRAEECVVHVGFPTPLFVDGRDEVHVGRLRIDPEKPNRLLYWVVSDNTRVGAALNAIQIMELLLPVLAPRQQEALTT